MNLFNCFQAVAFYTLLPFGVKYLFNNGHTGFAYLASAALFAGYILMSFSINDNK